MRNAILAVGAVLLSALLSAGEVQSADASDGSDAFGQWTLSNIHGKSVALREYADKPLVVVAFLGTDCPLAKLYAKRLDTLAAKYAEQGLVVLGISSNTQDSLTELTAFVNRHEIRFPMLKDVGNRLAEGVGATRTPEVFLYDAQRQVRYRGRVDDQYGIGYARDKAERLDLQMAIDEVLAGKDVSQPLTKASGCLIGRAKHVAPRGDITYTKHIAAILNARCVQCHRTGEIGPFTLGSYQDVVGWEDTILEVIDENRMPPWNANPQHGRFKNDARLSDDEKETLRTWIANGMPEGDAKDLPEPPVFEEGWRIPKPDQVFAMRDKPFDVPAEGVVDYQRFVVNTHWTEDKYITAAEARPDNRSVVHHILVYIIQPGSKLADNRKVLVGYAPGSLPVMLTDGIALHVPAGSRLLFELHYTPNGTPQSDASYVGVCFTEKEKVTRLAQGRMAIQHDFRIPPGADAHPVTATYQSRNDEVLLSMTPHMHLRGKAFRYEARYPDGTSEILLDVPRYDFNWQLKYVLEEPKLLPKGTTLICTALYDNSKANLANPAPERTVGWGDQSWEEMMIGFFDTIPPVSSPRATATID